MTWQGVSVLRPARESAAHAMDMASFPLAPYANRIAGGAFEFRGRHVRLGANYPGEVHPLHGSAWLAPWRVDMTREDRAVLKYAASGDVWPWRFSCTQTLQLTEMGAEFALSIENEDDEAMPASIGFHPAFPFSSAASVSANVNGCWLCDRDKLPTRLEPRCSANFGQRAQLGDAPAIDNCHTGWDGVARITTPDIEVELSASPELSFLHLYLPSGGAFLCAEPVSAMPDAFNLTHISGHGLRVLASGETFSASMRIRASTRGDR